MGGKILVTGATGNVGSAVVDELARRGAKVVAGVTTRAKGAPFTARGLEVAEIDFGNPEGLRKAMLGAKKVFLILPFTERMEEWGGNAVTAAREGLVKYVVRSSVIAASPADAGYELGRIHGRIDDFLAGSSVPYTVLRPNSFMQNYALYYGTMIKGQGKIFLPHGQAGSSLVDVRDIAASAAALLLDEDAPENHGGQAYDLTGPESLTDDQIAAILSEVAGKRIEYVAVDEAAARQAMVALGVPVWNIDRIIDLNVTIRAGKLAFVTDAVRRLASREPTPFKAFARDFLEYW